MRHENWPTLLSNYIERNIKRPFEWGKTDCALFTADVVREITGVDHAAKFRGRYKTALEARQVLKAFCGLAGVVERAGLEEINPVFASRGDVVLLDTPEGDALGIIGLDGRVVCQGKEGLTFLKANGFGFMAHRAWRVE